MKWEIHFSLQIQLSSLYNEFAIIFVSIFTECFSFIFIRFQFQLPKGTTIIADIGVLLYDEKLFPDPYKFDPERFLDNGKLKTVVSLFHRNVFSTLRSCHFHWENDLVLAKD